MYEAGVTDDNIAKTVGARLRESRMLAGLTSEQFARKLQIDSRDLDLIEGGAKAVSAEQLLFFANALGVHPTYFRGFGSHPLRTAEGQQTDERGVRLDRSGADPAQAPTRIAGQPVLLIHDELTGLPNRLLLEDRFKQIIASAVRRNRSVAVCYVGIDQFDKVNDALGKVSGDQIIKSVASRMVHSLRTEDTVCRIAGDEFVLVLVDIADVTSIEFVLKRLLAELEKPYSLDEGHKATISATIGVAFFPRDAKRPEALVEHADSAMRRGKELGGRRLYYYGQPGGAAPVN
jgi:diguanylate cyclase (GGDEF)-like protein